MIGGLLARIAGPRVLIGVVVAAAVGMGFLWWRLQAVQAEISAATMRADQYRAAHRSAVQALAAERQEAQLRERLLAERQQQADQRAAEIRGLRDALDQARTQGSQAYRECLDVQLPRALRDELRHYGRDPRAADADDPAAAVDGG